MDILVFVKLSDGCFAAPGSLEEITFDDVIDAIKAYNGMNNSRSMMFGENGNVYLTDSPSVGWAR